MRDVELNEVFEYNGVKLKCVKQEGENHYRCYFADKYCIGIAPACCFAHRPDKIDVIFVEV